jgi:hypothetical protein
MAPRITTHELADLLVKLQEALREAPDLPLADALKGFGIAPPKRPRAAAPTEPLPPVDPTAVGRDEMAALLQDKKRFRTKKALVEFARRHGVAVAERDKSAVIVGQILRVLYDIPQERDALRTLGSEGASTPQLSG